MSLAGGEGRWREPVPYNPDEKLATLLRAVSRSFSLTLRVLPVRIRPQIGLAYLLARTSDTIADTDLIPLKERLRALQDLRRSIVGNQPGTPDFGELARHQGSAAERVLLEKCAATLAKFETLDPADRQLVRTVLDTITSGQELDLLRFADATPNQVVALQTEADLNDYTYRVAGCVGEFWTRMCRAHLFPKVPLDEPALLAKAVRFGKGLQLVNILRDVATDLQHGRCYLPQTELADWGLSPKDLLQPKNEQRARPVYDRWLDCAEAHLRAGWEYTNMLPRNSVRVRLACAWPLLIGRDTLKLLRTSNPFDPNHRVKVSRGRVRELILLSVLGYPLKQRWMHLYGD